jgi:hypothetical protein
MPPPDQPAPHFVTCLCTQCKGAIEFDASDFAEGETRQAECPLCSLETTLFVPPASEQDASLATGSIIATEDLPAAPPTIAEVRQAELANKISEVKTLMRARLESGRPVFLYDSIYVPVDSQLLDDEFADEFDVSILRQLGLLGWDVVQAVPKTKGIGLENIGTNTLMSSVWGGGIGGNIMGVHIIIKKSVSPRDLTDDPADEVGRFISQHLSDFLSE